MYYNMKFNYIIILVFHRFIVYGMIWGGVIEYNYPAAIVQAVTSWVSLLFWVPVLILGMICRCAEYSQRQFW